MIDRLDWEHLRTFLAVLEHGGLSGAARGRGLSQPTAGRHIDALEDALGAALFTRSREGMRPTAEALRLAPHAETMASAAAALRRAAATDTTEIGGVIRLTASEIMAQEVLPPMLTRFVEAYPAVELEIVASDSPLNLLIREADIAVRMARPEQQAIIARRVGHCAIGLFARRDYLDRNGHPATLDELRSHRLIGYDRNPIIHRRLKDAGIKAAPGMFRSRSDSEATQLQLLRAGHGIGGMQRPLAARDANLVPVLPDQFTLKLEVWLAMHERLKTSLPMRRLMDHLAGELAAYVTGSAPLGVENTSGEEVSGRVG